MSGRFKLNAEQAARAFRNPISSGSAVPDVSRLNKGSGEITMISLKKLYDFKNHPFKVIDDDAMKELVESIKANGVLEPGIARHRKDGVGYEIISGHRRKHACELAGLTEMPFRVIDMDDDEAVIHMTDSNIYRPEILPSEKAKAYRMKRDALSHQGKEGAKTLEVLAQDADESERTVARYIRLSYLSDLLLDFVDSKKLKIVSAVELSYISEDSQIIVFEFLETNPGIDISPDAAREIRKTDETFGKITDVYLRKRLITDPHQEEKMKWTLKEKDLSDYFPENYSGSRKQKLLIKLIKNYLKNTPGDDLEEKWITL